ncbi:MAG: hypothetical protein O6948_07960 [Deltaproteobacteria bacterium]|nr:hypothetical protein [Deltaproteobacteria bacterium]
MARLLGNPAACHGHITHLPAQAGGVSPMESRSITLLRQNAPPGILPQIDEIMDRSAMQVTRLEATPKSVLQ